MTPYKELTGEKREKFKKWLNRFQKENDRSPTIEEVYDEAIKEEKCNLANKILDNWCRDKDDYCPHLKALEKQISDMSNVINDLVHLGTFDENTDEEYLNYEVHEALKKAEKYLPK